MPTEENVADQHTPDSNASSASNTQRANGSKAATKQNNQTGRPQPWISRAIVPMTAKLRSRQAQKLYRYNFQGASSALYNMSVILPTMTDNQSIDALGEVIDSEINAVKEELKLELERCTKVAEENGIDLSAVQYSEPKEIKVDISSPRAGTYFALIRETDRLISMLDMLWLSGLYTDGQYNTGCYQWQRKISRLGNKFRSMSQRTMAMAHRRMGDSRNASLDGLIDPDGDFVFNAPVKDLDKDDTAEQNPESTSTES